MDILKLKVTDINGLEHDIEGPEGWRLMEIIRDNGIAIKAECGACAACATCHIYVDKKWLDKLPEASEEEKKLLSDSYHLEENSRLSCQILMTKEIDGIEVKLTPDCE